MPGETVDAILMASGFSRRFGTVNKLAQPFCGKPLLQHTLALVCGMPVFSAVHLVYAQPEIKSLAKGYPVQYIYNQNPGRGQCESIRLGVLSSGADYYLFLPCDQPLLNSQTLQSILNLRRHGCIVHPAHDGHPGSPVLFSSSFRQQLLTLPDGEGGRLILRQNPGALIAAGMPSPLPLADIDTPEQLAALEKEAGC